jgi:hypothetical protein
MQHRNAVAVQSAICGDPSASPLSPNAGLKVPNGNTTLTLGAVLPGWPMDSSASGCGHGKSSQGDSFFHLRSSARGNQVNEHSGIQPRCIHRLSLTETVPPPLVFGAPIAQDTTFTRRLILPRRDPHGHKRDDDDGGAPSPKDPPHALDEAGAQKIGRRKRVQNIARPADGSGDDVCEAGEQKRYACPVEGCNKSYKQADGLKYHLK